MPKSNENQTPEELIEQTKTAVGAIAEVTYMYFQAMLAKGIDEDMAFELTLSFQKSFIAATLGGAKN